MTRTPSRRTSIPSETPRRSPRIAQKQGRPSPIASSSIGTPSYRRKKKYRPGLFPGNKNVLTEVNVGVLDPVPPDPEPTTNTPNGYDSFDDDDETPISPPVANGNDSFADSDTEPFTQVKSTVSFETVASVTVPNEHLKRPPSFGTARTPSVTVPDEYLKRPLSFGTARTPSVTVPDEYLKRPLSFGTARTPSVTVPDEYPKRPLSFGSVTGPLGRPDANGSGTGHLGRPDTDRQLQLKRPPSVGLTPLRMDVVGKEVLPPKRSQNEYHQPQKIDFDFGGLPSDVQRTYVEKRNIKTLYDWQKDCLSDQRLLDGTNCIVSLPTGAGKTLVAEVLMLREAIVKKRSSILVLPYVAIVQEKMNALSVFEESFNIRIEEYAASKGRLPPISRRKGASIFVCTIEKANMLINSLIEVDRLDSIGLVVVDELHMLGEGQRGATIEQLLTKYMHRGRGQVVGMSATLSNMDQLAKFLRAFVYSTQFRPVELVEFVRVGQAMLKVLPGGKLVPEGDMSPNPNARRDPDGVCQLLQGMIPKNQVIIFCPTKKNCENLALLIAQHLPKSLLDYRSEGRQQLVTALEEEVDDVDENMKRCLLSGIAYHHSGLTHDERKHIEAAYKDGILCVICATSTLAAGVNLPARRVIIRSPYVSRIPLGKAQYLQMIGRAGRPGFDRKGDSITIVKAGSEMNQFKSMLSSPMLSCNSSLCETHELASFLLDLLALKIADSCDSLLSVLNFTLLFAQKTPEESIELMKKALNELKERRMIDSDEDTDLLVVTPLGIATFTANMHPSEAPRLSGHLVENLNRGLVFSSHFHLLFTISPYDVVCPVNWDLFDSEYRALPPPEKALLQHYDVHDARILACIMKRPVLEAGAVEMRLYLAMLWQRVWRQESHSAVCKQFGVERGWLQSSLQSAISQAGAIARFAEKMEHLWPLRLLLPELVKRLQDCQQVELVPLLSLDCVKRGRAKQLYGAGYRTVAEISRADAADLVKKIDNLKQYQALKIVHSARALIRDEIDIKMEEIESGMGVDVREVMTRIGE